MGVKCKICGQTFNKMITNTHLKRHDMTVAQYKEDYGIESLTSDEYKQQCSEKLKGENNPNYGNNWTEEMKTNLSKKLQGRESKLKGKTLSEEHKEKMSETKKEKFASGETVPWAKGIKKSQDYKDKVSEGVKLYAENNKEKLQERSKKARQTVRERYGDDYLKEKPQKMRQAKTEESKKKIYTSCKRCQ